MFPTICQFGPVTIHSFGVMVAMAAIVCSALMAREAKRLSIEPEEIYDFVFWGIVCGVCGARVFYVFLNLSFFSSNPEEILMVQRGGLAWQGGVSLGALGIVLFIRKKRWPLPVMADFVAPYLALGHAIGRIGCFLNGCCYGKEVSWGIYFPVHGARLHPTQLYEMVLLVGLFFLLKQAQKNIRNFSGSVLALYFILSSAIRFGVEFFRADHEPLFLNLSVFQYVAAAFFVIGIILFYCARRKYG